MSLPIVDDSKPTLSEEELEKELAAFEAAEKERLGIREQRKQWVDNMTHSVMKRKERDSVTLLMGGAGLPAAGRALRAGLQGRGDACARRAVAADGQGVREPRPM